MSILKRNMHLIVFTIIFILLAKNSIPTRFLAPYCYRISFALAPVLYITMTHPKEEHIAWLFLFVKELIVLLFDNPGVGFGWHFLLTLSNTVMDILLVYTSLKVMNYEEGCKRVLARTVSILVYTVFCIVLNVVYHARLSAGAYGLELTELVTLAETFNFADGFWSFAFEVLSAFYLLNYLFNLALARLFKFFFGEGGEEDE